MPEKEDVFSSTIKYGGIFTFKEFYIFCYEWLTEQMGMDVMESQYEEKISGEAKDIIVEWKGESTMTDYFKFDMKVKFTVRKLTNIEIAQGGAKVKTNQGEVKVSAKGTLVRDYKGKFETSAFNKFLRSIYEKWVIKSRIDQFSGKIFNDCDEFLNQAKAYLDIEGKK